MYYILLIQVSQVEQVFIRGSMIRFLIVPDMLKNAPMFKQRPGAKGLAAGAGKSAMMRAQGDLHTSIHIIIIKISISMCFHQTRMFS